VGKVEVADRTVRESAGGVPVMWRRAASAAVLVPVFVWLTVGAPAWMFQALVAGASLLACMEMTRMLERTGRAVHARLAIGVGGAITASFATSLNAIVGVDGRTVRWMPTPELVLVLGVGLILSAPLWTAARPSVEATANTLFTAVYVGWLLGYAIWLQNRADGPMLVIFLVGVTWIGETAAYLVGSSMGRRPLAPVLSPKKTLEGAAAQVVASVAAGLGLGAWLVPGCSLVGAAGAGALLGVVGQVGDLAESAIKRSLGTKDAGELIPGHGGMLDRIDGLLFNAPALYFYSLYAWCRP
jgi:phosphatidate cytidylyltransferase